MCQAKSEFLKGVVKCNSCGWYKNYFTSDFAPKLKQCLSCGSSRDLVFLLPKTLSPFKKEEFFKRIETSIEETLREVEELKSKHGILKDSKILEI